MARFKLLIKPSAVKEIEAIPQKKERRRIIERIGELADEPFPPSARKLSGHDRYRIRQWNYRILYQVLANELIVEVVKVGHRKDVYRQHGD